jgi:hypothetical protein
MLEQTVRSELRGAKMEIRRLGERNREVDGGSEGGGRGIEG